MFYISRNELCRMTGMGYSQVQRYCDNKVTRIDLSVLERICTVLPNCNLNDLIKLGNEVKEIFK